MEVVEGLGTDARTDTAVSGGDTIELVAVLLRGAEHTVVVGCMTVQRAAASTTGQEGVGMADRGTGTGDLGTGTGMGKHHKAEVGILVASMRRLYLGTEVALENHKGIQAALRMAA